MRFIKEYLTPFVILIPVVYSLLFFSGIFIGISAVKSTHNCDKYPITNIDYIIYPGLKLGCWLGSDIEERKFGKIYE